MSDIPIEKMSFEQAAEELEKIVSMLEQGSGDLEGSIKYYERGVALKKHCEAKLKDAEAKIEKISMDKDGNVQTAALDVG